MTTSYAQNVLLDALCDLATLAALPLQMLSGLLGAVVAGLGLLWRCRRYIAITALFVGSMALCVACPLLPVGLAIVAGYGWATMPRVKAVAA